MPAESPAPLELPDLDDRLVVSEERYEMFDGELVYVAPAKHEHAERHAQVTILVSMHLAPEFTVADDMLTRTGHRDDIAPDVSVSPSALDLDGRRQIQRIAFEIVSTQSLGPAGLAARRARKLVCRGVHRVFAIDTRRSRALEWTRAANAWVRLPEDAIIDDLAFAVPLPLAALIRAAQTDDTAAKALLAKRNPVLEATRAEDRAEGRAEGRIDTLIEAVLAVLAARRMSVDRNVRERITVERDPERLRRWLARAVTAAAASEVIDTE
jgi:hypothetical protein